MKFNELRSKIGQVGLTGSATTALIWSETFRTNPWTIIPFSSLVPRPKYVRAADGLHHRYARTWVWVRDYRVSI